MKILYLKYNKKAVTLIEISICIVLSTLLLIGILNLFSSGMKGSAKALTHQDNMEAANILMRQIEYDLSRATEIMSPARNKTEKEANWVIKYKEGGQEKAITYMYNVESNSTLFPPYKGIKRIVDNTGEDSKDSYLAKGHPIKLFFTHFASGTADFEKHGMWVELEVGSQRNDVATITLKRLIAIQKPF